MKFAITLNDLESDFTTGHLARAKLWHISATKTNHNDVSDTISTAAFQRKYFSRSLVVKLADTWKTRGNVSETVQDKQEFVRPRWLYDMRPSARAEKYMCVIVIR